MTAEQLSALIRRRYPTDEYAVLFEVRNATGFAASRSADAIVFSLWPSRGLEVSGFEIKVSRADWVKEMRNPAKAEEIAQYCDRWWLVVDDEKIVQAGELPPTWGMMAPKGDGLRVVREAQKLNSVALDRSFVAAVCRAAQSHSPAKAQIDAAVGAARKEWESAANRHVRWTKKQEGDELARLRDAIKKFEEASGVRIVHYDAGRIGAAVRVVMKRESLHIARDLELARDNLKRVLNDVDELLQADAIQHPIETAMQVRDTLELRVGP